MRNSGRPKREPYQRRRRRNLVVVAFGVKIGLSSSISAGCIGAFVCLVRESLWDRFGGPPVSPAGGRTECAARDASCRRSEHASSTQCAVRPLARLDRSAATVPRTGITGGSACSAARCALIRREGTRARFASDSDCSARSRGICLGTMRTSIGVPDRRRPALVVHVSTTEEPVEPWQRWHRPTICGQQNRFQRLGLPPYRARPQG